MSLTEIAGHKFTEGLMRDRCSRCDIRWSDAIANRSPCTGHSMTDHYNAQYDEARQEVWNAVVGDSAGTEPVAPDAYEAEGDAAEPFMDIGTNPYCFSFAASVQLDGQEIATARLTTGWMTPPNVKAHRLLNGKGDLAYLALESIAHCHLDNLTWGEILALLEDRA